MPSHRPAIRGLALAVTVALLPLGTSIAQATSSVVVTAPSSANPGDVLDLRTMMPVSSTPGTVSQTIQTDIDPTRVKLTAATDIIAPSGWTVEYSTDGTNFTGTAPASAAAWAAVRSVRATGNVQSLGSSNGYQVAQGTATGNAGSTAPAFIDASGSGDGYEAFFDPGRTRVFNIWHHQLASSTGRDSHVRTTGATCAGFPYRLRVGTNSASLGRIVGTKVWVAGVHNNPSGGWQIGFECVELTGVITSGGAPSACATPWVSMGPFDISTFRSNYPSSNIDYNATIDLAGGTYAGSSASTRLWTMNAMTGALLCLDTATVSPCAGMPTGGWSVPWPGGLSYGNIHQFWDGGIELWGGRVYLKAWAATSGDWRLTCVLESNPTQPCPGFSGATSGAGSGLFRDVGQGQPVQLPAADGTTRGVCVIGAPMLCFGADGTTFAAPSSLQISSMTYSYAVHPTRVGTRVFYGNSIDTAYCWDASLASGAGAGCFGGAGSLAAGTLSRTVINPQIDSLYTIVPDPAIPDCAWMGFDARPTLRTYNMRTGQFGSSGAPACSGIAPTRMSFSGSPVIPRMACNIAPGDSAIRSWRSFALTSPGSGFTSATLTVQDETGTNIPGWTNVPLSASSSPPYSIAFDDTTLPVSRTGQSPKFIVDLINGASVTSGTAAVQAVGDAPQLCVRPVALPQCNQASGPGPVKAALFQSATASVTGTGSASPGGSFGTDSTSVSIGVPTPPQCGSTLTGRATTGAGGSGTGLAGVTVTLLDDTGSVLLDDTGNALTATTDDSGNYSFGHLKPGSYKVRFPSSSSVTSTNAQTASGGSGSDLASKNAVSGTSTSGTTVLAVGTPGVVNGQYIVNPVARPNTSSGPQGVTQAIWPLRDDSASTGASYSGGSTLLRLCGTGQSYPNCTQTVLDVSGGNEGRYTVDDVDNRVTFWPCKAVNDPYVGCVGAFTGTATPVTYQSRDSLGRLATSTITPTVIGPPVASNDVSSGAFAVPQSINVRSNDTPGSGQSLVASSIELCTTATTDASCDSGNAKSLVVSNQGIYTVDDTTGIVTFTPCRAANTPTMSPACTAGFSGAATPVKYIVKDGLGQIGSATITPTVTAPPLVIPAADTTAGIQGATQTVSPLANDDTVVSTVSADVTSVKICTSTTADSSCTGTSPVVVAGKGAYTVNASTGVITFTPCSANGTPSTPAGINCTGAFTGTPNPVKYVAKDNLGRTFTSTYTPTVVGAPTASADSSSGAFGVTQTISVLANDTAGTGGTLVASSVRVCASGTAAASCTGSSYVSSGNGVFTANANGTVSFAPCTASGVPDASCTGPFAGAVPAVGYRVTDSVGQFATSTITVTVSSPAVDVASADTSSGFAGALQSVNPLANDSAPTGVSLVASSVRLCTGVQSPPNCTGTSLVVAGKGVYIDDTATGTIKFLPCSTQAGSLTYGGTTYSTACTGTSFTGTPTPVTYQVSDNLSTPRTVSATYTPTVVGPPTAVDDTSSGPYGQAQTIAVLGNDTADSATSLVASSVRLCGPGDDSTISGAGSCDDTTLATAAGTYAVNANGTVSFTPAPGFSGVAPAVAYQVADALGQKDGAAITVTVAAPVGPTAADDTVTLLPGATASFRSITGAGGLATPG
ncbi:MAG: SdrD B-like domain-containing protein, partial [bacterium]